MDHIKGGIIHQKIRHKLRSEILKPGLNLRTLADKIEQEVLAAGAQLAFPVGIGLNHVAAHWAPPQNCTQTLGEQDLITIDFGILTGAGAITDAAFTHCLSDRFDELLEVSRQATQAGIDALAPGVPLSQVGKAISEAVADRRVMIDGVEHQVRVITNLCGHKILPYKVHGFKAVPNYNHPKYTEVAQEGEVYAIEPFITTAPSSKVDESTVCNHYMLNYLNLNLESVISGARLSARESQILRAVRQHFNTLCFSPEQLLKATGLKQTQAQVSLGLKMLVRRDILNAYPELVVATGHFVSQFESNALVSKQGRTLLTGKD